MGLKKGQIAVKKVDLLDFVATVHTVEKNIDAIMKLKESNERGKLIAKELNRLTYARHSFQHFQLDVPLRKLK